MRSLMIGPPIPPAGLISVVSSGSRKAPDRTPNRREILRQLYAFTRFSRQPIEAGDAGQRIRATAADSVGDGDTARPAEFRADARAFHIHFRDIELIDLPAQCPYAGFVMFAPSSSAWIVLPRSSRGRPGRSAIVRDARHQLKHAAIRCARAATH